MDFVGEGQLSDAARQNLGGANKVAQRIVAGEVGTGNPKDDVEDFGKDPDDMDLDDEVKSQTAE
jgi:hypothetical protein